LGRGARRDGRGAVTPDELFFNLAPTPGGMVLPAALLLFTYAAIVSERINRAVVALLGAGLTVVLGVLNQEQAIAAIDFNTIALLIGMMIVVGISRRSGLYGYIAIRTAQAMRGRPAAILAALAVVTALLSALLDNVTTVLLIVPVTLVICDQLDVRAYPFLFAEIFASNIGGTATLIGDPPNILIGSAVGLTFMDFVRALGPVVLVILALQIAFFHLYWGRKMRVNEPYRARVMALDAPAAIEDHRLMYMSLAVIGLVITGFVLARQLHLEAGTIALAGAALLMMLESLPRPHTEHSEAATSSFHEVDWITIFFFVGLFVVIGGVEHTGLLNILAQNLLAATGGDPRTTALAVLWGSAVLSAIVDNIPFVATMIPLIQNMAPAMGGDAGVLPLWWALSLGACLGGNGTLIGASANLAVAGIAEKNGTPIRFFGFALLAFPLMLASIAISHFYLLWRFF
jgi:Na+/H+ antiporter NhaD/arsenite permease-like protein